MRCAGAFCSFCLVLFVGKGEATGNVAIAGWCIYGLLALRAADHHAAKLRYICEMAKGMGNFF